MAWESVQAISKTFGKIYLAIRMVRETVKSFSPL